MEVVTPIREIDEVDVIRAASVRGHLRFWWRALYAVQRPSDKELHKSESETWGRAADEGGRSAVETRIDVERSGEIDSSYIRRYDSKGAKATPGAYALWPRGKEGTTAARRLTVLDIRASWLRSKERRVP